MKIQPLFLLLLLLVTTGSLDAQLSKKQVKTSATSVAAPAGRWSAEKAHAWYASQKWISGANFLPSTAINQLEMWQAATFDPATIDRELGWAQSIGFNTMRVYLHSVAWKEDPHGFKQRVGQYLDIADRYGIRTILVFFDDCWNKEAQPGSQPAPKPGIHNSGWVQDPGQPMSADSTLFPGLEKYVKDVMRHFAHDKRILLWDLYNEPGNQGKGNSSLPLLRNVFAWARAVNPDQPISVGVWKWDLRELNLFQIQNSDVITYHNYDGPEAHQRIVQLLQTHDRPLICTEYMARLRNSRFSNIMPMLKQENIGAINWGLVDGKSNTIYAWETPLPDGSQPVEWFHDVFRKDGKPYRQDEVDLIKKLNTVSTD
ncbi:MAG TPA: cellulase family glycosylhydrolase [Chitinophagaceae bacterium]